MKIEIDKPIIPQFVADWIEQLYVQGFNSCDLLGALFSRNYEFAEMKIFKWFTDDKKRAVTAILYGYEVGKEPLYYAKVKGWELAVNENVYWNYHKLITGPKFGSVSVGTKELEGRDWFFNTKMTVEQWNKLGINGNNADFEEVE